MKKDEAGSRIPAPGTYTLVIGKYPEFPDVRSFVIPELKIVVVNQHAPEGKIDRLIRINMG